VLEILPSLIMKYSST